MAASQLQSNTEEVSKGPRDPLPWADPRFCSAKRVSSKTIELGSKLCHGEHTQRPIAPKHQGLRRQWQSTGVTS